MKTFTSNYALSLDPVTVLLAEEAFDNSFSFQFCYSVNSSEVMKHLQAREEFVCVKHSLWEVINS